MKNNIIIFIVLALLVVPGAAVANHDISVVINGQQSAFGHPPVIDNGRAMVPMRSFFESLGADVSWDAENNAAVGIRGDAEVSIRIGRSTATVNGVEIPLHVPARLINDVTFIPLRFVGEALGSNVSWDPVKGEITIQTNSADVTVSVPQLTVIHSQTGVASWYGRDRKSVV